MGALILAINTIVLSIQAITSNIIDALANAVESLVGRFYYKDKLNMQLVITNSFVWLVMISLLLIFWEFQKLFTSIERKKSLVENNE